MPTSEHPNDPATEQPDPTVKPPPYGWFTHGYDPSKRNFKGGDEPDGKKGE